MSGNKFSGACSYFIDSLQCAQGLFITSWGSLKLSLLLVNNVEFYVFWWSSQWAWLLSKKVIYRRKILTCLGIDPFQCHIRALCYHQSQGVYPENCGKSQVAYWVVKTFLFRYSPTKRSALNINGIIIKNQLLCFLCSRCVTVNCLDCVSQRQCQQMILLFMQRKHYSDIGVIYIDQVQLLQNFSAKPIFT